MSDVKTITLPVSKLEVSVRQYTTRADDTAADHALYDGVYADGNGEIRMPGENALNKAHVYIERLTESVGGKSDNIKALLDDLRSQDYAFLKKEVDKIVEDNSPKE